MLHLREKAINIVQCFLRQLDYVVTCAVCTRTDAGDIHIHKKKSQVMQSDVLLLVYKSECGYCNAQVSAAL